MVFMNQDLYINDIYYRLDSLQKELEKVDLAKVTPEEITNLQKTIFANINNLECLKSGMHKNQKIKIFYDKFDTKLIFLKIFYSKLGRHVINLSMMGRLRVICELPHDATIGQLREIAAKEFEIPLTDCVLKIGNSCDDDSELFFSKHPELLDVTVSMR
jgi:hypothetical protein